MLKLSNDDFLQAFHLEEFSKTIGSKAVKAFITSIKGKGIFAIVNEGGIGIEPITYLFATNSLELIKFSSELAKPL